MTEPADLTDDTEATEVTDLSKKFPVLPYSLIVGQTELRRALEISYVDPGLGVLATGKRGTAKSTTIRAFSLMAYSRLPVTLPIGATDDRILGGLDVEKLLRNEHDWKEGLLEQASDTDGQMLYIDEVNLLEDHLVNVILDAASTGVLVVQRDNVDYERVSVRFSLVGTMNPDEGGLRPQLLDRFGLVAVVDSMNDVGQRRQILKNVLRYEEERKQQESPFLAEARERDTARHRELEAAQGRRREVSTESAEETCARLAVEFEVAGHRGEVTLIRAARALAALDDSPVVRRDHIRTAAKLALIHRRPNAESGTLLPWSDEDDKRVDKVLSLSDMPDG